MTLPIRTLFVNPDVGGHSVINFACFAGDRFDLPAKFIIAKGGLGVDSFGDFVTNKMLYDL